ncbi:MAG: serine/threonine protein kinase [Dysgonamonadaceae bacterium]|jgi:serine/threonine protein kinase|nr:serine/threonine protein kinase [Dysgonamonadaceae bacterium]
MSQELQNGYILRGETRDYRIERKLGQGGFGITYLATFEEESEQEVEVVKNIRGNIGNIQTKEKQKVKFKNTYKVAIKEFFMRDSSHRDGATGVVSFGSTNANEMLESYKNKARKEAKILSRFNNPNIVTVLEIFEANNTVYFVMEYIEGKDLREILNTTGKLEQEKVLDYALQICNALIDVHEQKILHLDIKPSNIMIDGNGRAMLMDFGISKQYDKHGDATSDTPVARSAGYAPIEQYSNSTSGFLQRFHPESDTYSLGATLYAMLTGECPLEATLRFGEPLKEPKYIVSSIYQKLNDTVMKAMNMEVLKRFQTAREFKAALEKIKEGSGSGETIPDKTKKTPSQPPTGTTPVEKQSLLPEKSSGSGKLKYLWIALGSVAAIFLILLLIGVFAGNGEPTIDREKYNELVTAGDDMHSIGNSEAALEAYENAFAIDDSEYSLQLKIKAEKNALFNTYFDKAKALFATDDSDFYQGVIDNCNKALLYGDNDEIRQLKEKAENKLK